MRTYFLIFIFLVNLLEAKEIVAFLKGVQNNHKLHMKYNNKSFLCKPYGIETVSELIERADANSSCLKHLTNFRKKHPYEEVFAQNFLHVEQKYSVEGVKGLCMLYISSDYSYSEVLLEKGYARIAPAFIYEDYLLKYRFKNSVLRAKNSKLGMWSDINVRNCFLVPKPE